MKAQGAHESRGETEMRTTYKIRIWLSLAVAAVSLVVVSSASAMLAASDGGIPTTPPAPVVTTPNGFNWGDAVIGAAVALAATLAIVGLAYVTRNRSRLAASH
jgi:hypothetical protein